MDRLIRVVAFALCAAALPAGASGNTASIALGQRLYEHGITVSGEPLRATGAAGIKVSGARAACVACHRRSGMGGHEGALRVPAVTGPRLFARARPAWPARPGHAGPPVIPTRADSRDAYDDARVARALRDGIDADGRPLDTVMPRYVLDAADERALVAYLRHLGSGPVPGFDAGVLRLATIITPDADPHRADVVATAMRAWSRAGPLGGLPIDLQVWHLEGPASTWNAQLQALLAARPPYAVLSGAGGAQWRPVRDFCERSALPCLFPIVDVAPDDGGDVYSVYLSRGVALEARLLARHLRERAPRPARVVQWVDDVAGREAARILADQLASAIPIVVHDGIDAGDLPQADDVVVAWLGPVSAAALIARFPGGHDGPAFFSAHLLPPGQVFLPAAWRREAAWISARSDATRRRGKGALGFVPWLKQIGLEQSDDPLLAEVYAATYFFGDALARMRGTFSREFLLETIESTHFDRPAGGAYFSLSLGPGQREAAKAGHVLRYAGGGNAVVVASPRLVP